MIDSSRSWYDLSLSSNVLKPTYITGIIDVSNNIIGRRNILINNEKDEGNSNLGIGTNILVNSINIQANQPNIYFTNSSIFEPTNNNTILGKIDFVSPIRGTATSSSIRCENTGNDYDNNGSLIFGTSNQSYNVVFFSNGNVGIGTTNAQQRLHVNGSIEFIASNSNIDTGIHSTGDLGLSTDSNLFIKSNTAIYIGDRIRINSNGVGIDGTPGAGTLTTGYSGYMRVTGRLYAKYLNNNQYSGWSESTETDESSGGWSITSGGTDYGGRAKWFQRSSRTLTPGLWIIFGYVDIAKRNNTTTSVYAETIGVGLGTNTTGNNLATRMYHVRGNRLFYSDGRNRYLRQSDYTRHSVCIARRLTSNTTIRLGVILGISTPLANVGLNAKILAHKVVNMLR